MENQHVMPSPVTRPAAVVVPAADVYPEIAFTSEGVDQADGHWPVCGRCRCAGRSGRVGLAGQGSRLVAGRWPCAHGLFSAGDGGR
jgi:hypothetical protein